MSNLLFTISVEGSEEKTIILNEALGTMGNIRVVDHDEDTHRGLISSGAKAIKWVVELLADPKGFGVKLCEIVETKMKGSTVKIVCPPGITIEVTNGSKGELLEVINAAIKLGQTMNGATS